MVLLQNSASGGVVENILQLILKSSYLDVFNEVAQAVVQACLGIAALFFLIMIAYHIGRQIISRDRDLNLTFLPKYFFLMLALTAYIPLMTTIVNPIIEVPSEAVKEVVRKSSDHGSEFKAVFASFDAMQAKARKDESFGDKLVDADGSLGTAIAQSMGLDFREMFFKLGNYIIDFLFDLVSFIVFLIRFYALGILFCIGPIAIAFSFLKPLEGSLAGWAKFYLVIHLWVLIIYIIDFASMKVLSKGLLDAGGASTAADGYVLLWQALLVKAGLIIVKLLTPKFADVLISGSQSGNLFSALTGAVTMAAGKAIGGVEHFSGAEAQARPSSPNDTSGGNGYLGEHINRNSNG